MNISSSVPQDFSDLNNLTNASLAQLSEASFNETAAIISAVGSSGGRTWDLKYYFIFCVPFLLSVPLFLVAGGILRWGIQSAAKYAAYWRASLLLTAPVIYVGFYWALPHYGGYPGFIVYAMGQYVLLSLFSGYRLYWALRLKRDQLLWVGFCLLVPLTTVMDSRVQIPYAIPVFPLLPWTFLFWVWIVRDRSG